jgi:protein-disulfide isomerase
MSRTPTKPTSRRERRAKARDQRPASPRRPSPPRQQPRPAWQSPVVLTTMGAILIGIVVIGFVSGAFNPGSSNGELVTPPTSYVGLTVADESVGKADAPVVMQVYSDFQCPACKLFITTELPSLLRDFVQPGLLRIESKDIDVIDRGGSTESLELAAAATCAADQGKYWGFHDLVFWNQGGENKGYHNAAFIDRVATAAELDLTAFHTCQARTDIRQPIQDRTAAAEAAGISATPTLVINGQSITGVPQYDQLHAQITQLLANFSPSPSRSSGGSTAPSPAPAAS